MPASVIFIQVTVHGSCGSDAQHCQVVVPFSPAQAKGEGCSSSSSLTCQPVGLVERSLKCFVHGSGCGEVQQCMVAGGAAAAVTAAAVAAVPFPDMKSGLPAAEQAHAASDAQQLCCSVLCTAAAAAAAAGLLLSCIQDPDPCLFFEPKML
jgi:hypothetical protein